MENIQEYLMVLWILKWYFIIGFVVIGACGWAERHDTGQSDQQ